MRTIPWRRTSVAALLALGTAACGASVSTAPGSLSGEKIAKLANAELAKNKDMAPGDLTCEKVKYAKGATTRCVRSVELEDGRLLRIGATVTITSVKDGGRFEIVVDDKIRDVALTAKSVQDYLAAEYAKAQGTKPTSVTCPQLPGVVGSSITCEVVDPEETLKVKVTVTEVDLATGEVGYRYRQVS